MSTSKNKQASSQPSPHNPSIRFRCRNARPYSMPVPFCAKKSIKKNIQTWSKWTQNQWKFVVKEVYVSRGVKKESGRDDLVEWVLHVYLFSYKYWCMKNETKLFESHIGDFEKDEIRLSLHETWVCTPVKTAASHKCKHTSNRKAGPQHAWNNA